MQLRVFTFVPPSRLVLIHTLLHHLHQVRSGVTVILCEAHLNWMEFPKVILLHRIFVDNILLYLSAKTTEHKLHAISFNSSEMRMAPMCTSALRKASSHWISARNSCKESHHLKIHTRTRKHLKWSRNNVQFYHFSP